jgi:hypothetical protein
MTRPTQNGRRLSGWIAAGSLLSAVGLGLALPIWTLQRLFDWSHLAPFASDLLNAGIVLVVFLIVPWMLALGVYLVLARLSGRAARIWLGLMAGLGTAAALMFGLVWAFGPRAWTTAVAGFGLIILIIFTVRHPRPVFRLLAWAGPVVAAAGVAFTLWTWQDLAHQRTMWRGRDVPVFVIVFDELSPYVLHDKQGRIDARLFPRFAGLAKTATWYANMSIGRRSCPVTAHSMLSGRRLYHLPPDYDPDLRDPTRLPPNIVTLLSPTRRLIVLEAWKRLIRTSPELKHPWYFSAPWSRGLAIYLKRWAETYARFLFGRDGLRGGLPRESARAATPNKRPPPVHRPSPAGACRQRIDRILDYDRMRRAELKRVRRFLAGLGTGRRQIGWLYSRVSHCPYWLGPDGEHIVIHPLQRVRVGGRVVQVPHPWAGERKFYSASALDQGETAFNLYRSYVNQVRFADRLLGLILDRIRRLGLFDSALIIVYSDHGIGFTGRAPGRVANPHWSRARRQASAQLNAHTLLMIKYPGQKQGRIDRRPARPSDVAPTVLQVLGLPSPWPMDGTSLLNSNPPARRLEFIAARRRPGRPRVTYRRLRLVAPLDFRPEIKPPRPVTSTWPGRPVGDLPIKGRIPGCVGSVALERTFRPGARTDAVLTVLGFSVPGPLTLIALNGRLVKAVRGSQWVPEMDRACGWVVALPPRWLRPGRNEVRAFVRRGEGRPGFAEVANRLVFRLSPGQLGRLRAR